MKIQLECGDNPITGYENFDSNPSPNAVAAGVKQAHFAAVPTPDGAAEYIQAVNTLSRIGIGQIDQVLQHWKSKLTNGGELYLEDNDGEIVGHSMAYHGFDLSEYNSIVFGSQDKPNIALYNLIDFIEIASRNGFIILDRGYAGHSFYVRLQKPEMA